MTDAQLKAEYEAAYLAANGRVGVLNQASSGVHFYVTENGKLTTGFTYTKSRVIELLARLYERAAEKA